MTGMMRGWQEAGLGGRAVCKSKAGQDGKEEEPAVAEM